MTLSLCLIQHGAPNSIKTDNAPEFKGSKWNSVLHKLQVESKFTELHRPNQNLSERCGGIIKVWVTYVLHITTVLLDYW